MLVAANRNPDILKCTVASIMETINRAAELGLDLSGTLGEAYPVPFNNRVKWTDENGNKREEWMSQLTLIIGYRGFAKLARQSGEVKSIDADVVKENDRFIYRKGKNAVFEFEPNYRGDRGEAIGAYAYVEFKDGGEQFVFMPVEDIEKVRRRSKSGSDRDGNAIGAWKSDWDEMAKKTVFRRCAKWLPLSTEKFVKAIERDDEDYEMADVLEAETTSRPRGAKAMMDRVKGALPGQVGRGPDGEPIIAPPPVEDEAEANRILEEKAAQAKQESSVPPPGNSTDPAGSFPPEQGGGSGEESQEPAELTPQQKLQAFKDGIFAACKKNGLTPVQIVNAWNTMMLKAGCKGAKEINYPEADRQIALESAAEGVGFFVKP